MNSRILCLFLTIAFASLATTMASALTPVMFTTNDDPLDLLNVSGVNKYRVENILVYVSGVKQCHTLIGATFLGNCNKSVNLDPGLHQVDYVWATCNTGLSCPSSATTGVFGQVTHYVLVPDQVETYYVRIPTVRVRWYEPPTVRVSLNGVVAGFVFHTVNKFSRNILSGCYTASYYKPPSGSVVVPPWPAIPGVPDGALYGFDGVCVGSGDTYPTPVPDSETDMSPPHVRIVP